MKCRSKYVKDLIYDCGFNDDEVTLWKDDFHVNMTKHMFNTLYELINVT